MGLSVKWADCNVGAMVPSLPGGLLKRLLSRCGDNPASDTYFADNGEYVIQLATDAVTVVSEKKIVKN